MYLIANWKAYVSDLPKAKALVIAAKKLAPKYAGTIVLAPPAPLLGALAAANRSKVAFCAQDVSETSGGAKTGENLAAMYASAGASYAIVGHSERRAAGDTDADVAEKLGHVLACGLTPVLCVGEHEHDGEGRYLSFIREQLSAAFAPFSTKERTKIIVAYEPVWAIGKTAAEAMHPEDLTEMVLYIHKVLGEFLPGKAAGRTPVLYGGSVEPNNIRDLASTTQIDGFLVGHASVDPKTFSALVQALS